MASAKDELRQAVYAMLEGSTILADARAMTSSIGQQRAQQFNVLLGRCQDAFPTSRTLLYLERLADYDSIVLLNIRLIIMKTIIDRSAFDEWWRSH
jgi:hypothetical protein